MVETSTINNNADKAMGAVTNAFSNATENFKALLKNKNKWGMLYLIFIIIVVVWLLVLYVRGKLNLKSWNNNEMVNAYESLGGTSISGINVSNPKFANKLRDYYVMASYNSCCGGNIEKDFVDMIPLNTVMKQGARWLDFEIYSLKGEPVVAAGPEPSPDGKYCLKGTYNSLPISNVLQQVRMMAFSGAHVPNPDDPLFLSFRIKTNNRNIFPIMANKLKRIFSGLFLGPKYSYDGKYNKSGSDVIPNIPLLNLRKKVIIFVDDPNSNYRETEFEEFVNMSGRSNDGTGMPFVKTYKNIDIVQAYDAASITEENKKFLGITMPDFSKVTSNPPAAIHQKYGCQFVMMNFSVIDANMQYYLNFFGKKNGAAYVLKPDHLRYFEKVIAPPKRQNKEVSYATKKINLLGGSYTPGI